jgi:hypothetical protein
MLELVIFAVGDVIALIGLYRKWETIEQWRIIVGTSGLIFANVGMLLLR